MNKNLIYILCNRNNMLVYVSFIIGLRLTIWHINKYQIIIESMLQRIVRRQTVRRSLIVLRMYLTSEL